MEHTSQHTFVVCAYKESPYLEECIQSLLGQTVQSNIILSTSTPNAHISNIAGKYGLPVFVNTGKASIAYDWNFGYGQASTPYVTLAHQDDVYLPEYLEHALAAFASAKRPLLFFTDYYELRDGKPVQANKLLKIKRLLLLPMRFKCLKNSRFVRRRCLSLGCPVCCPSVSFAKENLPNPVFEHGYRSNVDWQAWERLSKLPGAFLYCKQPLMMHRVHEDSETSAVLKDNVRTQEDYEMFCKFWPRWIAKRLTHAYASSEKSNQL
ncbi:MAG: glycosyltransferase [Oscillospiraceae bacterium]